MNHKIQIRDLSYRYRRAETPSLDKVNLSISEGSVFGLLGPNGAGKTTLVSLLIGMLKLQDGSVNFFGTDLRKEPRKIKKIASIVPQQLAFYEALTGRENLEYFASLHGYDRAEREARITVCAEICRLGCEKLNQRSAHYSGGLKRRLNLAIGLLNQPRILYLDEPTVGVDLQSRLSILESIRDLSKSGVTVIYTSHYMEEIETLCDEVAVVDKGRVLTQQGFAELSAEVGAASCELELLQPLSQDQIDRVSHYSPVVRMEGKSLTVIDNMEQCENFLRELTAMGVHFKRVNMEGRTLQQWYLSVIERSALS